MTRRTNASRFYYARIEADQDADYIPDGELVFKVLRRLPRFKPYMVQRLNIRCHACRQKIFTGDTAFATDAPPFPGPVLCYRCGIAWEIHNGRLTLDQADAIPPFGGPV